MTSEARLLQFHEAHMLGACGYGALSRAERAKVGATVVKDGSVISFGFNGTPQGWDNTCEDSRGRTKPEVVHAERNALAKVGRVLAQGGTLYCTYSPCGPCAIDIINHRISEVVYLIDYRQAEGLSYLDRSMIPYRRLDATLAHRIEAYFGWRFNWEGDDRRCCNGRHGVNDLCVPASEIAA